MTRSIQLHATDNVRIIVDSRGVTSGENFDGLTAKTDVPQGHKIAAVDLARGAPVLKFGHVIGVATRPISRGEHVHVHNVSMPPEVVETGPLHLHQSNSAAVHHLPSTFKGYLRKHGRAGTRNYVVVASSVNCSATVVKAVCRQFAQHAGIDGVVPVTHQSGCAQAVGGLGYQVLNRTLAGWIFHPNVVGAVVIGLGCEGTTFRSILDAHGSIAEIPIETLNIQDVGGTAQAIKAGVAAVERVLSALPGFERQELPMSHLGLALNCGGSDAFSSLTANPALGLASDLIVEQGGMVALAEIPECHGCESMLSARAVAEPVRQKLEDVFSWWRDYAARHRVTLNENLAAGNIIGGITTIIEKSLGAVAKGGHAPVREVLDYAEVIHERGLVLMNTPGFDPVSVTGLVAGGCNLVAFTTGRGSAYGCSIAPTVKIATRTELYEHMKGDMDFDAGRAMSGMSLQAIGEELYCLLVEVASGRVTCSEQLGIGWEEFVPWPLAETL